MVYIYVYKCMILFCLYLVSFTSLVKKCDFCKLRSTEFFKHTKKITKLQDLKKCMIMFYITFFALNINMLTASCFVKEFS